MEDDKNKDCKKKGLNTTVIRRAEEDKVPMRVMTNQDTEYMMVKAVKDKGKYENENKKENGRENNTKIRRKKTAKKQKIG